MGGFGNKNYVVDKIVDKGHQGNSFKAQRVSDGIPCTIKELDVRHMTEEEREDAKEEIRVLGTVYNENVIRYYDAFEEQNRLYVVTEFCDQGVDLGKLIRTRAEEQKFFSEAQVWSYFIQMLRGLVALHSKGLIHRNVRSGNVIRLNSNGVKLGHVGVGKLKEGSAATQIGDPHYVPPEVWKNKAYTFKGDVWAVGCVLYEMIALTVPFGGCSLPDLRMKVIEGRYQPIPSSFSSALNKVLKLLLHPHQGKRISATDMLAHPMLTTYLQHSPASLLRVRASRKHGDPGLISAKPSDLSHTNGLYPTVAVRIVEEDQVIPQPGLNSKKEGLGSKNEDLASSTDGHHLSGLPVETAVTSTTSLSAKKVPSILAPRAILSSPDNDAMLSERNRPPNAASKLKVPRVATLAKSVQKPLSQTTSHMFPPEGLQVHHQHQTPTTISRVNLKHFKTAYIHTPKTATADVLAPINNPPSTPHGRYDVSQKEKSENTIHVTPGTLLKKKSLSAFKVASAESGPETSLDSVRSLSSSYSDDFISALSIRAPIDCLDPENSTQASNPAREKCVESAGSPSLSGSHHSDDPIVIPYIRVRKCISDINHSSNAATPAGQSSRARPVVGTPGMRHPNAAAAAMHTMDSRDYIRSRSASSSCSGGLERSAQVAPTQSDSASRRAPDFLPEVKLPLPPSSKGHGSSLSELEEEARDHLESSPGKTQQHGISNPKSPCHLEVHDAAGLVGRDESATSLKCFTCDDGTGQGQFYDVTSSLRVIVSDSVERPNEQVDHDVKGGQEILKSSTTGDLTRDVNLSSINHPPNAAVPGEGKALKRQVHGPTGGAKEAPSVGVPGTATSRVLLNSNLARNRRMSLDAVSAREFTRLEKLAAEIDKKYIPDPKTDINKSSNGTHTPRVTITRGENVGLLSQKSSVGIDRNISAAVARRPPGAPATGPGYGSRVPKPAGNRKSAASGSLGKEKSVKGFGLSMLTRPLIDRDGAKVTPSASSRTESKLSSKNKYVANDNGKPASQKLRGDAAASLSSTTPVFGETDPARSTPKPTGPQQQRHESITDVSVKHKSGSSHDEVMIPSNSNLADPAILLPGAAAEGREKPTAAYSLPLGFPGDQMFTGEADSASVIFERTCRTDTIESNMPQRMQARRLSLDFSPWGDVEEGRIVPSSEG